MVESLETEEIVTTYAYDIGGNLTHVNGEQVFFYGNSQWKDQLTTAYGKQLIYDEIGNLKHDGTNTYRWQKGSQLAGINSNIQYTYDYTGLRSSKTVDTVKTDFVWVGGLLMAQVASDGNTIAWSYDGNGKMLGFTLNGAPYFYLRNLQGDVVAVLDTNGIIVAEYSYDAWGEVTSAEGPLADINPIRYRGYYWDSETGYYYCQSRYYNPEWCRWISADVFMDTRDGILGTNMYAYCQNNPVNYKDPTGYALQDTLLLIADTYLYIKVPAYKSFKDWTYQREINARTKFADNFVKDFNKSGGKLMPSSIWSRGLENYTPDELYIYAFTEGYDRNQVFMADTMSLAMMSGGIQIVGGPIVAPAPKGGVSVAADDIISWLGPGAKVITNSSGDKIFMSADRLRKVRFDVINPGADFPHAHLEVYNGKMWVDAGPIHRIYPKR